MATFVTLRHLVNILVRDFTNRDNLTNDLLVVSIGRLTAFYVILVPMENTNYVAIIR